MKNKEFLNICYAFFNRFITADKLIEKLLNIDKSKMKKAEQNEIDELINNIKNISNNTPNEEDEYVKREKETIKRIMDKIELIPRNKENKKFLDDEYERLKKEYSREKDSHERWIKIMNHITDNDYFNECYNNQSDYELLELITQYINAPFPPLLNQEEFEDLVKIGIEKDERESLWRLAFNYLNMKINFDSITNYFIKIKDGYYLSELISVVGQCLDIEDIINKINDKELIEDLKNRKGAMSNYVSEEQFNRLIDKLN